MQLAKPLHKPVSLKAAPWGNLPMFVVQMTILGLLAVVLIDGRAWPDAAGLALLLGILLFLGPPLTQVELRPDELVVRAPLRRAQRIRTQDIDSVRFAVGLSEGLRGGLTPPVRVEIRGRNVRGNALIIINAKVFSRRQLAVLDEYLDIEGFRRPDDQL